MTSLSAPQFCPSCGHNFSADEPVVRGAWELTPSETFYHGRKVNITGAQSALLHTLAAANGRAVRREAIGARISNTEEPGRFCGVVLNQMRKRIDAPWPVENVYGLGYRWCDPSDNGRRKLAECHRATPSDRPSHSTEVRDV